MLPLKINFTFKKDTCVFLFKILSLIKLNETKSFLPSKAYSLSKEKLSGHQSSNFPFVFILSQVINYLYYSFY